jgi:ribosomal protein S12
MMMMMMIMVVLMMMMMMKKKKKSTNREIPVMSINGRIGGVMVSVLAIGPKIPDSNQAKAMDFQGQQNSAARLLSKRN